MMLPFHKKSKTNPDDQTILDRSITNSLNFCQRVILVTGHRGDELTHRYQHHERIKVVHNTNYATGLFSSIQVGMHHAEQDYLFITHGDMPFIPSAVFSRLWQNRKRDILFPCFQGKPGHPVLLHKSSFNRVLNSPASCQMKVLLRSMPHRLLPVDESSIRQDIDTREVYEKLCSFH